jgi:enamine deaminase RidA (YjgF/YER057c/UK114 family)
MARQLISSGSPFEERIGFSRAVRVGDRVVVSGTAPVFADGSCPSDVREQARRCLEIIGEALVEAGARLDDVIRTRTFLVSADDADAVMDVHRECFGDLRPASTMVVVAGFLDPRWRVEFEAEAVIRSLESRPNLRRRKPA